LRKEVLKAVPSTFRSEVPNPAAVSDLSVTTEACAPFEGLKLIVPLQDTSSAITAVEIQKGRYSRISRRIRCNRSAVCQTPTATANLNLPYFATGIPDTERIDDPDQPENLESDPIPVPTCPVRSWSKLEPRLKNLGVNPPGSLRGKFYSQPVSLIHNDSQTFLVALPSQGQEPKDFLNCVGIHIQLITANESKKHPRFLGWVNPKVWRLSRCETHRPVYR
jgi:hypothetical protein